MKTRLLFLVAALLLSVRSSPVEAQYEKIQGFHEHDGFFLRFQAGFGAGRMVESEVPGGDVTLSGTAGAFRIQIGGSIAGNLVLFGEMGGAGITNPQLEWNAQSQGTEHTYLSITDVGAGLTWYFMPSNIYICGSVTLSKDRIEFGSYSASTRNGAGACLSVGKEWWAGAEWGPLRRDRLLDARPARDRDRSQRAHRLGNDQCQRRHSRRLR